jgi:3-deoxy-manno-octulosonate cytidylyltransferase (CMP-KDO synthetase)
MKTVGIIPARYQSTRLPGKALIPIAGKPLIQRVYENALKSQRLDLLIVATDDERILECVQDFSGEALMTPADLASGSDRCAWVAHSVDADIVANIQGDEPFLDTGLLDQAIELLEQDSSVHIVTAAIAQLTDNELNDPNIVKVLIDKNGDALYFSRQNIPYIRTADAVKSHPALQHIGLYVFRRQQLLKFVELPQTPLEKIEQLEQLRILENGDKIRVLLSNKASIGIDIAADLEKAERVFRNGNV